MSNGEEESYFHRDYIFLVAVCYAALGLVAIYINSYQGIFNKHTARWNNFIEVDRNNDKIFDWSVAQFLADEDMYKK